MRSSKRPLFGYRVGRLAYGVNNFCSAARQGQGANWEGLAGCDPPSAPYKINCHVSDGRGSDGLLAPGFDPGLNRRLVHPGGGAQLGDLPIPGGVALVLAIAEGRPAH
jgi:hypothetical protein